MLNKKFKIFIVIIILILIAIGSIALYSSYRNRMMFTTTTGGGFRGRGISEIYTAANIPAQNQSISFAKKTSISPAPKSTNRMMIKNIYLRLLVKNPLVAIDKIQQLANSSGGFVVNSSYTTQQFQRASVTIRIPTTQLNNTLALLHKIAIQVLSERRSSQDVTLQYIDTQSRLNNLLVTEKQLKKILQQAKKVQDVLEVYKSISNIRGQIDRLTGRIKYYKDAVNLDTINIALQSPVKRDVIHIKDWHLGSTITNSVKLLANAVNIIINFFFKLVILYIPVIVISLIPIMIIIWLFYLIRNHIKNQ